LYGLVIGLVLADQVVASIADDDRWYPSDAEEQEVEDFAGHHPIHTMGIHLKFLAVESQK